MANAPDEPTNAEVLTALGAVHDELVVRKAIDARWRQIVRRLLVVALVSLGLLLGSVGALGVLALSNRKVLVETRQNGQEIKDCTTPADQTTPCQKRQADAQAPVLRALSEDNLRASIAVGSCLREQAPNVEECALERFRASTAAAAAKRSPSP